MTQKEMDDLYKRKQFVDIHRAHPLIPFSGIHPIIKKTKEQYKKEFDRGTFNEVDN
jgi:hypothetical protein